MWSLYIVGVKDVIEPIMFNRLNLILICLSSVAVAVFVSLIPEALTFWGFLGGDRRPLGLKLKEEFGCDSNSQHAVNLNALQLHQTTMLQVSQASMLRNDDLKGEALAALHLAQEHLKHDKKEKALKLYRHALALAPNHPDVLNEYGEFLERNQKDVLTAEHLYCRALIVSPTHSRALQNRERTLPLVEEIDQSSFNRIDQKRDVLVKVPDSHPAMRRMKKESYFHHIYHTAAIEGNTFTLSQTRSLVETRLAIGGKSIMEHNEILGLEAALNYVNSTLVHRIGAVTVGDILNIHKRVLGFVDPIGAGEFRTTQVFVGSFVPPGAKELDKLMREFVSWLNSDEAMSFHPIELAALAHYKLVSIHPFYDGNGRTSRLLMNFILMQAGYPPVTIRKEDKLEYYQHLESANGGDVRPFIRFISRCTERTLDEYLWATTENSSVILADIRRKEVDSRTIIIEHHKSEP